MAVLFVSMRLKIKSSAAGVAVVVDAVVLVVAVIVVAAIVAATMINIVGY